MNARELEITSEMLHEELQLCDASQGERLSPPTPESLHRLVADQVAYLLEHDFSRLLASLYQIDVPEELVAEAFRLPSRRETASRLAGLIIDREAQKAQSRANTSYVESELQSV